MPSIVNPAKGYLVNTNNRLTSSQGETGISHAFAFSHRSVRISELIENLIASEKPIKVKDIQEVQMDLLDVQARQSLPHMIQCVDHGSQILDQSQKAQIELPLQLLAGWDFKFTANSVEASIFEAWEFMVATHMHESKIDDTRLRRSLWSIGDSQLFFYRQVSEWAAVD